MKPIFKFNDGLGATLCNKCSTIIHRGKPSSLLLCNLCVEDYIYNYPTKYKQGFTHSEMLKLIYDLRLGKARFFDKLGVNTAMIIDGEWLTYHTDVARTAVLITENREMRWYEWD